MTVWTVSSLSSSRCLWKWGWSMHLFAYGAGNNICGIHMHLQHKYAPHIHVKWPLEARFKLQSIWTQSSLIWIRGVGLKRAWDWDCSVQQGLYVSLSLQTTVLCLTEQIQQTGTIFALAIFTKPNAGNLSHDTGHQSGFSNSAMTALKWKAKDPDPNESIHDKISVLIF